MSGLPMGTIMAACMWLGLAFASVFSPLDPLWRLRSKLPLMVRQVVGGIVVLAGCWNALWHALRHLTEFWGAAALISGVLMVITGIFILGKPALPAWLTNLRSLLLVGLLGCALLYSLTIISL